MRTIASGTKCHAAAWQRPAGGPLVVWTRWNFCSSPTFYCLLVGDNVLHCVNCITAFRSAALSLAAIGVLAVFPAEAGQSCDNNGRCTTFELNASVPGK